MENLDGWIYKVVCKINNKIYIGQTTRSIKYRWEQHVRNSKKKNNLEYKNKFHRAIRKYGEASFYIEEICHIKARTREKLKERLNKLEEKYIKSFDSFKSGYNSSWGGDYNPLFGVKYAEHPSSVKINQYSLDGKFIKTWGSSTEVRDFYHKNITLSKVCSKKYKRHVSSIGYIWKYYKDYPNENDYKLNDYDLYFIHGIRPKDPEILKEVLPKNMLQENCMGSPKAVLQYDLDGNFIKEWKSIASAAKEINIFPSSITNVCRGKKKQAGFYIWKYKTEDFPKKIEPYIGRYKKKN